MTAEDLVEAGYSRALWVPSPEPYWLRPGGLSICSETVALKELAALADEEANR